MNYVRLGDLCVINSGGTPRRNNESYWKNGDIPWVKISDLKNGIVESTEEFITLDGLNNSSAKIFPKGTLLYTIFATIGEVAILKMDAATNQAIVGIQLKENQEVYLKYIYYYLKSQTNNIKQLGRGVAQNNINLSVVKNMVIPIVSLEKQSNIIATLNKLEKIKENRITILTCLDDLIKSRFVEMFGDPNIVESEKCVRFSSIAKIITGNTPSRKSPEYYGDYIEWIKSDNIVSTDLYISQAKELLSEQGAAKGRIAPKNSLLMTCIAGSIRSIGNVGLCDRPVAFNQQINAIVLKNDINPLYVYWLLKLFKPSIIANVEMSLKGIISKSQLENMFIPIVASDKEQALFAKFVLEINKLKSDVQKSIDETQLLMDSLMQEYFG